MDTSTWRDLESSGWSHPDPRHCPCHGSGWMLSAFDTWHRCAEHGTGVPFPENDLSDHDGKEHFRLMCRKAFAFYRENTGMTKVAFLQKVKDHLHVEEETLSPQEWVAAAEEVAVRFGSLSAPLEVVR